MVEIGVYVIESRKICWPTPDATCLEGGCGWCEFGVWKTLDQVEAYASKAGVLKNRGIGEKPAMQAYRYGLDRDFHNRVPLRTSRDRLAQWADGLGALTLREFARGMPNWHNAKRPEMLAWLLRYRRDDLEISYFKSARGRLTISSEVR